MRPRWLALLASANEVQVKINREPKVIVFRSATQEWRPRNLASVHKQIIETESVP
jgi:hypothetical protein